MKKLLILALLLTTINISTINAKNIITQDEFKNLFMEETEILEDGLVVKDPSDIEKLIKEGKIDVNATLTDGNPIIFSFVPPEGIPEDLDEEIFDRYEQLVELFLKDEVNPNIKNKEGYTLLMHAASLGYANIVEILLEYKADPTIKREGKTALDMAKEEAKKEDILFDLKTNYFEIIGLLQEKRKSGS